MCDPALTAWARQAMVREQLAARDIRDPRVLAALERVPRERFVPAELAELAYGDRALPIACAQTISQPYMVARMSEALELAGHERVLEIGTGSGYQTAVLAELAQHVWTIERHPRLSRQAQATLAELGYANVTFLVGDGTLGWPSAAPYDRILVTAAAATGYPPALFEQLAEGGRLVIPTGDGEGQLLEVVEKRAGRPVSSVLLGCRFVPLVGGGPPPRPAPAPPPDRAERAEGQE